MGVLAVERYGPGEGVADPRPGDVVLIHGESWVSAIIYLFERLRPREDRPYTHWSHTALVAGGGGMTLEVNDRGVVLGHLDRYRDSEYHYLRLDAAEERRLEAVEHARRHIGERYRHTSFLRLGLRLVFRRPVGVGDRGQQVCTFLVGRALERAGETFAVAPHHLLATDIAKHFGVRP